MGSCNSRNDWESGKTMSWHEKAQYASVPTTSDDVIESDTESPGNEERNGLLPQTEKETEDVPWDIDGFKIPKIPQTETHRRLKNTIAIHPGAVRWCSSRRCHLEVTENDLDSVHISNEGFRYQYLSLG
jgi:hypothetical protein